jgi:hypothetical protein
MQDAGSIVALLLAVLIGGSGGHLFDPAFKCNCASSQVIFVPDLKCNSATLQVILFVIKHDRNYSTHCHRLRKTRADIATRASHL